MKAVDLGLSVLWADKNIGANLPESYGEFFSWGEIRTQTKFDFESYRYFHGDIWNPVITKYNGSDHFQLLQDVDDAASCVLQLDWHIPTKDNFEELFTKCSFEWGCRNGIRGYYFIGPNGNRIFLPAAGFMEITSHRHLGTSGLYWTSELVTSEQTDAWMFLARSNKFTFQQLGRFLGCPVRAVCDFLKENGSDTYDLLQLKTI